MSKWSSAYRDSRWQKLRLEVMERDCWACCSCGKGEKTGASVTLNVHHSYYDSGKAPWEYDPDTLFTLCEECHALIHAKQKELMYKIMNSALGSDQMVQLGMMERFIGYLDADCGPATRFNNEYNQGYSLNRISLNQNDCNAISRSNAISMEGGAF